MNPFEFVLGIVIVVMVAGIIMNRQRYKYGAGDQSQNGDVDSVRMKEEIRTLRERIQVLERIATDKESGLEREIERLRDR
jgi:hypothetical protein